MRTLTEQELYKRKQEMLQRALQEADKMDEADEEKAAAEKEMSM